MFRHCWIARILFEVNRCYPGFLNETWHGNLNSSVGTQLNHGWGPVIPVRRNWEGTFLQRIYTICFGSSIYPHLITLSEFMFIEIFKLKRKKGHSGYVIVPWFNITSVWEKNQQPYKANRFLMVEDNFIGAFHKCEAKHSWQSLLNKPTHGLISAATQSTRQRHPVPSATGLPQLSSDLILPPVFETTHGLPESLNTFPF